MPPPGTRTPLARPSSGGAVWQDSSTYTYTGGACTRGVQSVPMAYGVHEGLRSQFEQAEKEKKKKKTDRETRPSSYER